MATSKRELIVAAIMNKLATVAGVNGRVYRAQADPNPRELTPFVTVEWTNEQAAPDVVQMMGRVLTVVVSVYTRGDGPDTLADSILVSAHQKITADPSLGGLAIDVALDDANAEILAADLPAARVTHNYSVKFWHKYEDLTT